MNSIAEGTSEQSNKPFVISLLKSFSVSLSRFTPCSILSNTGGSILGGADLSTILMASVTLEVKTFA
ncbi:MAG: hypothetical protein ACQEQO_06975 [Thermodesulfobacteriota bacterium]